MAGRIFDGYGFGIDIAVGTSYHSACGPAVDCEAACVGDQLKQAHVRSQHIASGANHLAKKENFFVIVFSDIYRHLGADKESIGQFFNQDIFYHESRLVGCLNLADKWKGEGSVRGHLNGAVQIIMIPYLYREPVTGADRVIFGLRLLLYFRKGSTWQKDTEGRPCGPDNNRVDVFSS